MCWPRSACCSASRRTSAITCRWPPARRASAPRTWPCTSSARSASTAAPAMCSSTAAAPSRRWTWKQRMTLCNMSIEAGARAGLIAPDETTFDYLRGRAAGAAGRAFDAAVAHWRELHSDPGARFDRDIAHRCRRRRARPSATARIRAWSIAIAYANVPPANDLPERSALRLHAAVEAGQVADWARAVDVVFIGSCTNSRSVGPARRRGSCCAADASPRTCACWWCRARSRSSARPKPKACDRIFRARRRRMARAGLLDVHRHERRHRRSPGNWWSAPATAISKAGRARARAPCWPVRRSPPPARIAGCIADPRDVTLTPARSRPHERPDSALSDRAPRCCRTRTSTPTASSRRAS